MVLRISQELQLRRAMCAFVRFRLVSSSLVSIFQPRHQQR